MKAMKIHVQEKNTVLQMATRAVGDEKCMKAWLMYYLLLRELMYYLLLVLVGEERGLSEELLLLLHELPPHLLLSVGVHLLGDPLAPLVRVGERVPWLLVQVRLRVVPRRPGLLLELHVLRVGRLTGPYYKFTRPAH
jgi:hypothetical protein